VREKWRNVVADLLVFGVCVLIRVLHSLFCYWLWCCKKCTLKREKSGCRLLPFVAILATDFLPKPFQIKLWGKSWHHKYFFVYDILRPSPRKTTFRKKLPGFWPSF
jgi:hypothetical protein